MQNVKRHNKTTTWLSLTCELSFVVKFRNWDNFDAEAIEKLTGDAEKYRLLCAASNVDMTIESTPNCAIIE
jgi:hypothetical protein